MLSLLSFLALTLSAGSFLFAYSQEWPLFYLQGLVAGACAVMLWRASNLSTFLKIFATLFTAELVIFGSMVLGEAAGLWPPSLQEWKLPHSFPLAVGIFALLSWGISYVPVVKTMMRIADPYFQALEKGKVQVFSYTIWQTSEKYIAYGMIVGLVLINQAQVAIMVRLSFFNRDWFNAIQEKDAATFWMLLFLVFLPWAFIYVTSAIAEYVVKSMLILRWRRWLTHHYVTRWMSDATHYHLTLLETSTDNPDQRIAEDVNRFIDGGESGYGLYSYSILLIATMSTLVSFSLILWEASAQFPLPGTQILVPGFLFWVALAYACVGTWITHLIGRRLVPLFFARQKCEANFRFSLARLREYSEQVALLKGETRERATSMGFFRQIFENYLAIIRQQKRLITFVSFYDQLNPIIPYLLTAPFYFLGKIPLGVMTQTAGAFGRVQNSLTFFITYYTSLADFRAVLDRLSGFDAAMKQVHHSPPFLKKGESTTGLSLRDFRLELPNGQPLLQAQAFTFLKGENIFIQGPSGCGKSTLFRALVGVWPYVRGEMGSPPKETCLLLPQKPYLPMGSIREALCYPQDPAVYSDLHIQTCLKAVGLYPLWKEIDVLDIPWFQRLSGGEQQRVAFARALLFKPDWLFLDEATASLDEASERQLYQALKEHLPNTTYISVGHCASLAYFHDRCCVFDLGSENIFTLQEIKFMEEHAR